MQMFICRNPFSGILIKPERTSQHLSFTSAKVACLHSSLKPRFTSNLRDLCTMKQMDSNSSGLSAHFHACTKFSFTQ